MKHSNGFYNRISTEQITNQTLLIQSGYSCSNIVQKDKWPL